MNGVRGFLTVMEDLPNVFARLSGDSSHMYSQVTKVVRDSPPSDLSDQKRLHNFVKQSARYCLLFVLTKLKIVDEF